MQVCSQLEGISRQRACRAILQALSMLLLADPTSAQSEDVIALMSRCGPAVHPATLIKVISNESGGIPYAIGRRIRSPDGVYYTLDRQPSSKAEAISWATYYIKNKWVFDAGLMQVRSTNFSRFALTAETVFDPCENVRAGSTILSDFYQAAVKRYGENGTALGAALGAYKTGSIGKIASP